MNPTFEAVSKLKSQGKSQQSSALALEIAHSCPGSHEIVRQALQFIVSNSTFRLFPEIVELASAHVEGLSTDAISMQALGYAAWVAKEPDLAEACLRRLILLDPKNTASYHTLVMLYLEAKRGVDAYIVANAGRQLTGNPKLLSNFMPLIDLMAKGVSQVSFALDSIQYTFRLSCFNGQAVEADLHHCAGTLTEYEELKFLKSWLPRTRKIVECGCLGGNHTVFFLKNFDPVEIAIYDADPQSLEEMAANVALNATDDMNATLNAHHNAIDSESGRTIELFGSEVETISLAEAISSDTDFVKIDIDGMEKQSLPGLVQGLKKSGAYLMVEVKNDYVDLYTQTLADIGYSLDHDMIRALDHNLFFSPN